MIFICGCVNIVSIHTLDGFFRPEGLNGYSTVQTFSGGKFNQSLPLKWVVIISDHVILDQHFLN
jgi:hypothetical protein